MRRNLAFAALFALLVASILLRPELSRRLKVVPTALAQQFSRAPLYRYQNPRGHYLYARKTLPAGLEDGPWENEGIACYVPDAKPHGTTPVYQMMSQTNDLGTRYFFTTNLNEVQSYKTQGWTEQGIVFHVATTKLSGAIPLYRLYKGLAPAAKKNTSLFGKIAEVFAGPEFTSATADVLQDAYFYTSNESEKAVALKGGFTELGILGYVWPTALAESTTEMSEGTKPRVKSAGGEQTSIPLALNLLDVREVTVSSGQLQGKLTAYDLAITNANKLPADAFQDLAMLPPNPCAGKSSRSRLQAEIIWGREGKDVEPIMRGTCIPLTSPKDLAKMTFTLSGEKGKANLLQVIVHDRLTGFDHKSNVFPVSAFGVGKALFSLGCTAFLGRPDDFICPAKSGGMAACQNLQKQGKPIKCREASGK
jgi:Repeat of unknown function (DUF5648)